MGGGKAHKTETKKRSTCKPAKNPDGSDAQCITDHGYPYEKNSSCSHRRQGRLRAAAHDSNIYNKDLKDFKALFSQQGQPSRLEVGRPSANNKKVWRPKNYGKFLELPRKNIAGDWYVLGPLTPGYKTAGNHSVKVGGNFTKQTWPYWNNHHHLIPVSVLKAGINNTAKKSGLAVSELKKNILTSPYNLNGQPNMLILPMDKSVANLLGITRHLLLTESIQYQDPSRSGKAKTMNTGKQKRNHPAYNCFALTQVEEALQPKTENEGKGHPKEKDNATLGEKLNAVSDGLREMLKVMGDMSADLSADHIILLFS